MEEGDRRGVGRVLVNIGNIHLDRGEFDDALATFRGAEGEVCAGAVEKDYERLFGS